MKKIYETFEAKNMFEKLGYRYSYDDGFIDYHLKDEYKKIQGIKPNYISFNIGERQLFISNSQNFSGTSTITIELFKAINKEIEELGWK